MGVPLHFRYGFSTGERFLEVSCGPPSSMRVSTRRCSTGFEAEAVGYV